MNSTALALAPTQAEPEQLIALAEQFRPPAGVGAPGADRLPHQAAQGVAIGGAGAIGGSDGLPAGMRQGRAKGRSASCSASHSPSRFQLPASTLPCNRRSTSSDQWGRFGLRADGWMVL